MKYVALLRGINVGGKNTVAMARLKQTFSTLGLEDVRTYINSGNVVFSESKRDESELRERIEAAIEREFGFAVPVVLRSLRQMQKLVKSIPPAWMNDASMKCDVMFLWPAADSPKILEQIPFNPEVENVEYFPGAVVWRIDRAHVNRGRVIRIVGTAPYKQMTIRNVNTVRKLLALMEDTNETAGAG